jgi:hypothetical protein
LEEKAPAAAQMLLKALEDPDPTVAFTAAELLGNFPGDPTISEALVEKIISILQSLYQFENKAPRVEDKDGSYFKTSRPVPKRHHPAWEESSLRVTFEAAASALLYVGIPDRFLQAKLRAAIHQLIAPYGEVYFRARYKEYNLNASIDSQRHRLPHHDGAGIVSAQERAKCGRVAWGCACVCGRRHADGGGGSPRQLSQAVA